MSRRASTKTKQQVRSSSLTPINLPYGLAIKAFTRETDMYDQAPLSHLKRESLVKTMYAKCRVTHVPPFGLIVDSLHGKPFPGGIPLASQSRSAISDGKIELISLDPNHVVVVLELFQNFDVLDQVQHGGEENLLRELEFDRRSTNLIERNIPRSQKWSDRSNRTDIVNAIKYLSFQYFCRHGPDWVARKVVSKKGIADWFGMVIQTVTTETKRLLIKIRNGVVHLYDIPKEAGARLKRYLAAAGVKSGPIEDMIVVAFDLSNAPEQATIDDAEVQILLNRVNRFLDQKRKAATVRYFVTERQLRKVVSHRSHEDERRAIMASLRSIDQIIDGNKQPFDSLLAANMIKHFQPGFPWKPRHPGDENIVEQIKANSGEVSSHQSVNIEDLNQFAARNDAEAGSAVVKMLKSFIKAKILTAEEADDMETYLVYGPEKPKECDAKNWKELKKRFEASLKKVRKHYLGNPSFELEN